MIEYFTFAMKSDIKYIYSILFILYLFFCQLDRIICSSYQFFLKHVILIVRINNTKYIFGEFNRGAEKDISLDAN